MLNKYFQYGRNALKYWIFPEMCFFSTVQDNGGSRNLVILSVKGRVVYVHPVKAYCGSGDTVLHVLNLGEELSDQICALAGIPSGKESPGFIEQ